MKAIVAPFSSSSRPKLKDLTVHGSSAFRPVARNNFLAALIAAGTLLLSACGGAHGGSQSGFVSGPKRPDIAIEDASYPAAGVEVPGLTKERIASSIGVAARWEALPGQREFNEALTAAVSKRVEQHAEAIGGVYEPQAHGVDSGMGSRGCVAGSSFLAPEEIAGNPELSPAGEGPALAVVCDPVLAAGDTFGERLRFVVSQDGQVTSDTVETLYTSLGSGEVATENRLLNQDHLGALYGEAAPLFANRVGLEAEDMMPVETGAPALVANISAVQFDDKGAATITVDRAFLESQIDAFEPPLDKDGLPEIDVGELPEPTAFSLLFAPELIHEYFTELGQRISEARANGTEWSGSPTEVPGRAYVNCDLTPCVALTFDDGPSQLTPQLLQDLTAEGAAATFYLIGTNAEHYPEIVAQIVDSGNQVGNHSLTHPPLTTLSADGVSHEIATTNQIIEEASGVAPNTVRPPYGDWNESVLATAGMPFIMWSIDTLDWQKPGAQALIDSVVHQSEPGDIVLMHDIHETTTTVVPQMLPGLKERGFSMVTIDQLLAGRLGEPDVFYSR